MAPSWFLHPQCPNRHLVLATGLQTFAISLFRPLPPFIGGRVHFQSLWGHSPDPTLLLMHLAYNCQTDCSETEVFNNHLFSLSSKWGLPISMIWPQPTSFALSPSSRRPMTSMLLNSMVISLSSIYLTWSSSGRIDHSILLCLSILFVKVFFNLQ